MAETASIVRVGQGYDLHRLVRGRKLMLAGVEIAGEKGLLGHSDADVVLHAVIDALLGAAGLGDIGEMFPDHDPAYQDIASGRLLEEVLKKIEEVGYRVANVDTTIITEEPKLGPYKKAMREKLSEILGLPVEAVSIKAKTNEGLGETGQGRAMACLAMVSLCLNE